MAITKFIPQLWSSALLVRFAQSEVLAQTCNRSYEGDLAKGNTVHITSVTTPTVVDYKAAGRTITPADLTDTQIDLLIDQEKAFAFNVDDIDRVQAAGSFEPVTMDAARALVEDSESFIAGKLLSAGTLVGLGTDVVDTGDKAFDKLNAIRTTLSKAKVPAGERFFAVNPDFSSLLLGANSKLTAVNISGDAQGLREATLGRILGGTVVESTLLGTPGKAAVVGYHRSAMAYVNQIDKVEALRSQTKFADIVRALHVYGAKAVRPEAIAYWAAA